MKEPLDDVSEVLPYECGEQPPCTGSLQRLFRLGGFYEGTLPTSARDEAVRSL